VDFWDHFFCCFPAQAISPGLTLVSSMLRGS
jgi:hypothetical protein